MKTAAVLLAPGFEEVEAVTPVDFLRRGGIEVTVLGVGGRQIAGSHGISVRADEILTEYKGLPDALVLPGGMPGAANIAGSPEAMALIRKVSDAGALVAAICASPGVVLGNSGLLSGKKATCFPGFEKHFPADTVFSEERVVTDGALITSRGAGTAAEFALEILKYLGKQEEAEKIRKGTLQPGT